MAKSKLGSKKSKRLSAELDQLMQEKNSCFVRAGIGVIAYVVFLIIRTALVQYGVIAGDELVVNIITYGLAMVAAGVVGVAMYHWAQADSRVKAIKRELGQ